MPIAIGLRTRSHVFVMGETVFGESIVKVKVNESRTARLSGVLVNVTGKQADELSLRAYAVENSKYIARRYAADVSPRLVASVIQKHLHQSLRSGPLNCYAIVGGVDGADGGARLGLYGVDPYGACHSDAFVVTGYGLYFLYGLYDAYYSEDMGEPAARFFLSLCLKALKERLVLETEYWSLDIVSADGTVRSETIRPE